KPRRLKINDVFSYELHFCDKDDTNATRNATCIGVRFHPLEVPCIEMGQRINNRKVSLVVFGKAMSTNEVSDFFHSLSRAEPVSYNVVDIQKTCHRRHVCVEVNKICYRRRGNVVTPASGLGKCVTDVMQHVSGFRKRERMSYNNVVVVEEQRCHFFSAHAPQTGCSKQTKDELLSVLDEKAAKVPSQDMNVVAGDLNGHVGAGKDALVRVGRSTGAKKDIFLGGAGDKVVLLQFKGRGFKTVLCGSLRTTCAVGMIASERFRDAIASCSKQTKDELLSVLDEKAAKVPSQDMNVVAGDLNGHVGAGKDGYSCRGGFGYGPRNADGERILEYADSHNFTIVNTKFPKRVSHLISFYIGNAKTQIDYVLVGRRDQGLVTDVKTVPYETVATQHRPLICTFKFAAPRRRQIERCGPARIKWWRLNERERCSSYFSHSVADSNDRRRNMERGYRSDKFSAFCLSTTKKLADGVESIRWSILSLVMSITIPSLIIVIMVVFCIYYTKLYIIRRASISAASAIVGLAHSFAPNASKRNRNPNINAVIVEPTVPDRERLFVPPVYALYSLNRDHCSLPYIEVVINNIPTVASFDREASISHMRITSLVTLNDTHKAKHSNSTPARDANGSTVSSQSIDHRFHIPSDYECPVSVLFGSDFIHSLNAWVLKVTLDLFNDSDHRFIRQCKLIRYFILKDNTMTSENGQCPIMVLNLSWTDIIFYKNMNIAKAYPEQVFAVDVNHSHPYVPLEGDWESRMSYFPVAHTMRYDIAKEVDLSNSDLTEEQKNRLHNVIRLHSKAFVGFDGQASHLAGNLYYEVPSTSKPFFKNISFPHYVLKVKKEKGAVWTCEHRLTLIEEVRSYRYIWDMKSNDHKKKKLATASWRKMVDYINARHGTEFTGNAQKLTTKILFPGEVGAVREDRDRVIVIRQSSEGKGKKTAMENDDKYELFLWLLLVVRRNKRRKPNVSQAHRSFVKTRFCIFDAYLLSLSPNSFFGYVRLYPEEFESLHNERIGWSAVSLCHTFGADRQQATTLSLLDVIETVPSHFIVDQGFRHTSRFKGPTPKLLAAQELRILISCTAGIKAQTPYRAKGYNEEAYQYAIVRDHLNIVPSSSLILQTKAHIDIINQRPANLGVDSCAVERLLPTLRKQLLMGIVDKIICHGGFGYGSRNADGERNLEYAESHNLTIVDTVFRKRDSRLISFYSGNTRTQIDFVLVKDRDRSLVTDAKVVPYETVAPQHRPLICTLKIAPPRLKQVERCGAPRIKWWRMKEKEAAVISRVRLPTVTTVDETWEKATDAIRHAARSELGITKPGRRKVDKQAWLWTDDVKAK
ncbi:unnamed protein product, partial [Heligmosomoides polygyrus]